MKKILLDAREMEHPIPLQIALNHLKTMSTEEYLYMIHRKNPIPLLELAKEKAFSHLSHEEEENQWHILISKNRQHNLKDFLNV